MCGIGRGGGVDGEERASYWDSVRLVDFLPDAAEQQQRRWQMTQQAAVRDVRSDPIPPAAVDRELLSGSRSLVYGRPHAAVGGLGWLRRAGS